MPTRNKIALLATLLAIITVSFWYSLSPTAPDPQHADLVQANRETATIREPTTQDGVSRARLLTHSGSTGLSKPRMAPGDPIIPTPFTIPLQGPSAQARSQYIKAVRAAKPADYTSKLKSAEAGDPEAAYWLFFFCLHCMNSPRTEWQLDLSLARESDVLETMLERISNEDILNDLINRPDQLVDAYHLCSAAPADLDLRWEARQWLHVAVDGGNMAAQFGYLGHAGHLLFSRKPLALTHPDLVFEFTSRSLAYAESILNSDHPERWMFMSRFHSSRFAMRPDPVLAYAYAIATNLEVPEFAHEARNKMYRMEEEVSPAQRREAEQLARKIIEKDRSRQ